MSDRHVVIAGGASGNAVDRYRRKWPKAIYHIFEPEPETFQKLSARFQNDDKVMLTEAALTDSEGPLTFYVGGVPQVSSTLPFNEDDSHFRERWSSKAVVTVDGITLDGYCEDRGIKRIVLIELDVQGGELPALRGMEGLLKRGAVGELLVEVFFNELYKGVPLAPEVSRYMARLGYRGGKPHTRPGIGWGDIRYKRGQA